MTLRDIVILGTSSQQPTRLRNHGAYLVRWNEEGFLFDPGEGTQRQFIYANVPPPMVTRIFVSHFHGDHCLGLGSMLMRLNLDKVPHPIHCYYPKSGKVYFDRLRYGTSYKEYIKVIEHPVEKNGVVHVDGKFTIEAMFLEHGIDNLGWRITEADTRKFDKQKLAQNGIRGEMVALLEKNGSMEVDGRMVHIDDVSHIRQGDAVAVIIDTRPCPQALQLAKNARVLICESTYLEPERELADEYLHLTAKMAAHIAKDADAKELILTHFSARYQDEEDFFREASPIFPNTHAAHDLQVFPFPK